MADEITGCLTLDLTEELHPDVSEVGAILRARTRSDATGNEIGSFNDTTRPTAAEVESFIDLAQNKVLLRLPDTLPLRLVGVVRELIAIRAAMRVELSYDPDRTGDGTAYARLKDEYDDGLAAVQDAAADEDIGTIRRISSLDAVSPTLEPYPDDLRELVAPPWPYP